MEIGVLNVRICGGNIYIPKNRRIEKILLQKIYEFITLNIS